MGRTAGPAAAALLLGVVLLSAAGPLSAFEVDWSRLEGLARGKVKAFITEDLPLYHNLDMKHLPGSDPELILLNHKYEELQRIPLSEMSREEINRLVQELGFYRKEKPDSPVPDEFLLAPAKRPPGGPEESSDHFSGG
uniref:Selenoprotein M n=1 Tax=Ailuropoda melanoleuca TaxID=9646 RepID=A0A7N5JH37_AILME